MGKSPSTVTSTTQNTPNPSALAAYQDVIGKAQGVAATPYQPFTGELVAGLNGGQQSAISQLQGASQAAQPYLQNGSSYLGSASAGLGAVQPYLKAASQSGANASNWLAQAGQSGANASNWMAQAGQSGAGANAYMSQAASLAGPGGAQAYMSPYLQSAVAATQANLNENNAEQQQQVVGNAIQQGAWGGDRSAVAQSELARQQSLSDGQTISNMENQGYQSAQQTALQGAGVNQALAGQSLAQGSLYGSIGQQQLAQGSLYGSLGQQQLAQAGLYGNLGQLQGQTAQSYAQLGGLSGYLGQAAESTGVQGASAALQGYTLQQQNQQSQDAAAYQQYQSGLSYPFQTTGWLSNIAQGIGSSSGGTSSTTSPGPSTLSQVVGAGTAGLGILGATGAFGSSGYLTGSNGLLSGFARGGSVGLAGAARPHRADGGSATAPSQSGGFGPFRPTFFDGGITGGPLTLDPSKGIAAPNPMFTAPDGTARPGNGGAFATRMPGLGGAGAGSMPAAPSSGLGVVSGAPSGLGSATPSGGLATADSSKNPWLALASAGAGMAASTSPFFGVGLGQGLQQGLQTYQNLQSADRANALAQSEIDTRKGQLTLSGREVDLKAKQMQVELAALQRQLSAGSILSGGNPSAAALPDLSSGSSAAQPAMPALGSPSAGSAGPAVGAAPAASTPSLPAPAGGPSPSPAMPSAASPASSTPTADADFWSGVDPLDNPNTLAAMVKRIAPYNPDMAKQLMTQRQAIIDKGMVVRNGQMTAIPGFADTQGAVEQAKASGKQAGEVQKVWTLDGDQIPVPGPIYQQMAKNGGGTVNGQPVFAGESPYIKPAVEAYGKFNENAMKFEEDYQQNVHSLSALAGIYSKFQAGRGTEAAADLDGLLKQAGWDKLVPEGWQNSQAGYDAALKSAVDQSFKQLADSGATKAPATGLREAMLTAPRPDANPAAIYKIITDKLAALNYSHDMYGNVINGNDKNVTRAVLNFQRANKYDDYVNAARAGTPLPAGLTKTDADTVLGSMPGRASPGGVSAPYSPGGAQFTPTPPPGPSAPAAQQAAPSAIPPARMRSLGTVYQTPKGPARWMGSGWQLEN